MKHVWLRSEIQFVPAAHVVRDQELFPSKGLIPGLRIRIADQGSNGFPARAGRNPAVEEMKGGDAVQWQGQDLETLQVFLTGIVLGPRKLATGKCRPDSMLVRRETHDYSSSKQSPQRTKNHGAGIHPWLDCVRTGDAV